MSVEAIAITTNTAFLRMRNRILTKLSDGPLLVEVSKPLLRLVLDFFHENFVLYDIVDETESTILLYAVLPEHYINMDENIEKYSVKLANPKVLREAIKLGYFAEAGTIESPRQFIRYVREWTLGVKKLVLLVGTVNPVRGALLFTNGKLKAVWAEIVFFETGVKAIRQLMYYGPYKYLVIKFHQV